MLDPYRDRVVVAEIDANEPLEDTVDIALYDSFAQAESDGGQSTSWSAIRTHTGSSSTPGTSTRT